MSLSKRRWERQMEERWSSVGEKYVCGQCFDDYAIRGFIEDSAASRRCDYCLKKSRQPIAAEMDEVLSFIAQGIHREYEPPEENVPYDSSEGGWQVFEPEDGYDLVRDLELGITSDSLLVDVTQAFIDTQWVQKDPFGLTESDALRFTWESFCEQIKHHTRFVFYRTTSNKDEMEELGHAEPYEILETIGKLVLKFDMISTLKSDTRILRARQHMRNERFITSTDLGAPPRDRASQSRMSPAGISMFYGADTVRTAFVETLDETARKKAFVTFGTFKTTRSLRLLDLTSLPNIPSLFDEGRAHDRMPLIFLHGFTDDTVKPVTRDGREHYEYVPTQVVAEYFRHVFQTESGEKIDGIKFNSSRAGGTVCYSLFCTADDCGDPPDERDKTLCLTHVRRCRLNFRTKSFRNAP
jgi:hypothetical protein